RRRPPTQHAPLAAPNIDNLARRCGRARSSRPRATVRSFQRGAPGGRARPRRPECDRGDAPRCAAPTRRYPSTRTATAAAMPVLPPPDRRAPAVTLACLSFASCAIVPVLIVTLDPSGGGDAVTAAPDDDCPLG